MSGQADSRSGGPGTSDLDLTLVGDAAIGLFDVRRLPPRLRALVWLSGGASVGNTFSALLAELDVEP